MRGFKAEDITGHWCCREGDSRTNGRSSNDDGTWVKFMWFSRVLFTFNKYSEFPVSLHCHRVSTHCHRVSKTLPPGVYPFAVNKIIIIIIILLTFLNPLALELDLHSLAHHLCKMWIFYELRSVTLGNTRLLWRNKRRCWEKVKKKN